MLALAERAPVALFYSDADGRLVHASRAACALMGRSFEELTSGVLLDLIHADDVERIVATLDALRADPNPAVVDHRIVLPDGSLRWARATIVVDRSETGELLGFIGTSSDITERVESESALRRLADRVFAHTGEGFLRSLLDHFAETVGADEAMIGRLEGDDQIRVVYVRAGGNLQIDMAYGLAGTPCAQVVGGEPCVIPRRVQELYPQDTTLVELGIEAYVAAPLAASDGRRLGLLALLYREELADPDLARSLLEIVAARVAAELERREAEHELEQYRDHLEELVEQRTEELRTANAELESFSYSVAHDLRSPLRIIDGYARTVLDDYPDGLDEKARDLLDGVCRSAGHMGKLIDDLLGLARVSRAPLERERVDLSEIARDVVGEIRAVHPDVHVEFRIAEGLRAWADRVLVRELLANLLDNAAKFSSRVDGATVELGREGEGGRGAFFVRDNGAGFDMEFADKLFVPFHRLHASDEFPGTGVGLATVHRIVQRHRGEIWAASSVGQGATFYFTLSGS